MTLNNRHSDMGQSPEDATAHIERVDRYTITINGHRVRADASQEARIRAMDSAGLDRFLHVMGYVTPSNRDGAD